MSAEAKTARVGVTSLVFIAVTAFGFPAMGAWPWAVAMVIVGYLTFVMAIVGSLYSIIIEGSNSIGIAGVA